MSDKQNQPQELKVDVGDVTIRYLTAGSGEPVVLLHGLGNSVFSWHKNIVPLSRRYRVITPDLPGHGYSISHVDRYDLPAAVEFLAAFLDYLGISQADLIGSSMGGSIALRTSLDLPNRVRKLVLVGSAGLGREVAYFLRLPGLPGLGRQFSKPSRKKTLWTLKRIIYDHSLITPELIDESHKYRSLPGVSDTMVKILQYGLNMRGQKDKVIMLDRLGELDIPVQVVWGAQDRIIPVSHAYSALQGIRNARLHTFDKCGHWPQMEKPEVFNSLVCRFLDESLTEKGVASTTAA